MIKGNKYGSMGQRKANKKNVVCRLAYFCTIPFSASSPNYSALDLASICFISPLHNLAIKFRPLEDLSILEKFEPYIQPPWLANISCNIPPRAEAILSAKDPTGSAIFTDSSARNGHVGIGIYS